MPTNEKPKQKTTEKVGSLNPRADAAAVSTPAEKSIQAPATPAPETKPASAPAAEVKTTPSK